MITKDEMLKAYQEELRKLDPSMNTEGGALAIIALGMPVLINIMFDIRDALTDIEHTIKRSAR